MAKSAKFPKPPKSFIPRHYRIEPQELAEIMLQACIIDQHAKQLEHITEYLRSAYLRLQSLRLRILARAEPGHPQ